MNKIEVDKKLALEGVRAVIRVDPHSLDANDLYVPVEVFKKLCLRFKSNKITFVIRPFFDMSPEMADTHPKSVMLKEVQEIE